jgi:chromosome condensin MukBEF ATPase and DNA-binding subunit MukB
VRSSVNQQGKIKKIKLYTVTLGLVISSHSSEPLQDNQLQVQVSETQQNVTALSEQISQLNQLVQDSVLQRITLMETELGELSA